MYLDQSYSEKTLKRFQRRIRMKGMTVIARRRLLSLLDEVSKNIERGSFKFKSFQSRSVRKKKIWRNKSRSEELILRYTNHILKRIFAVKQSDRNQISAIVVTLLESGQSFKVIKCDLKNFYESIPYQFLLDKLSDTSIVSVKVLETLRQVQHATLKNGDGQGIPRGVCLSATVAEIYMRDFDNFIRSFPSVFYYARFVDDIVIFCHDIRALPQSEIQKALPKSLLLNKKKSYELVVSCRCMVSCKCVGTCKCERRCTCKKEEDKNNQLQYLGYKYIFSDLPEKQSRKARSVVVRIADVKIKKIKTRIINSFLDYFRTDNFSLLYDRIQFLTSNYFVYGNISDSNLKAGIYYSYPNLTDLTDLSELDLFLKKTIFARNGAFGRKVSSKLSDRQKIRLTKLSFTCGYENRTMVDFAPGDINLIKQCWNNG